MLLSHTSALVSKRESASTFPSRSRGSKAPAITLVGATSHPVSGQEEQNKRVVEDQRDESYPETAVQQILFRGIAIVRLELGPRYEPPTRLLSYRTLGPKPARDAGGFRNPVAQVTMRGRCALDRATSLRLICTQT